jgi:hypothetical protein
MDKYNRMDDPALEAQNLLYIPNYGMAKPSAESDWRGVGGEGKATSFDMYNQPTGGGQNKAFSNIGKATQIGQLGTGAMVAGGIMSGGTGFIVAGLIQLAGGLLSAIFSKPQLTPEQEYFNRIVSFYSGLGKRSANMRNTLSKMTGKPADSYIGRVGYRDASDAFNRRATFVTSSPTVTPLNAAETATPLRTRKRG